MLFLYDLRQQYLLLHYQLHYTDFMKYKHIIEYYLEYLIREILTLIGQLVPLYAMGKLKIVQCLLSESILDTSNDLPTS